MTSKEITNKRRNHKFTQDEDARLSKLVNNYGESAWDEIAALMDGRNPRQCHDRWCSYLSPNINNAPFTAEEDKKIIKLQPEFKGKWVQMSKRFKGRTDIQLRNRWNILKKHLLRVQVNSIPTQIPNPTSSHTIIANPYLSEETTKFADTLDQIFSSFNQRDEESLFNCV